SFNLNSIPPALIERIEVYKGVVPIHLSDDALGGAINVVLKKGVRNSLNASVSYGSFNTFQGNFSGVTRNDKSGFTLKASGFYNYSDNDYEVWGKFVKNTLPNGRLEQVRAKRFNDAFKSIGGQVEVGFTDVKWADQFFISFNASDSYREIQHGTYMTRPYMGRFEDSDAQVASFNYRKKDFLVKGLHFNVTGMYSQRLQVVNDTVKWNYNWFGERSLDLDGNPILSSTGAQQGAPTINSSKRNVYTLRGDLSYEINPNHRFVFNHLYYNFDRRDNDEMKSAIERNFIETRFLTKNITGLAYEMRAFDTKLKTNVFSKYYQQEIEKVKPTLKTIDGLRQQVDEHFSSKYDYLGYGAAVSYLATPSVVLLTSFEKAIRLPVENEIFGDIGENIIENNSLQAEISNNINLGFKVGPYKIDKHKVSVGANGFIRNTKDRIVRRSNTRINDAEQTAPFENLSSTKSKGFEIELNYEFNQRFILFANLSRFNTVYSKKYDDNGNIFGYYNQQLPNEPFFTASGSAQYTIPDFIMKESVLNLHYGFNMIDAFYTNWLETDDFQTPKQFIQDLGLSYIFPNKQFVLSFDAKNIFNKEAYDNFAVQKPGRAFYVKLNYSFNKF
ncbi:MAG TPA: outer membrane beta-barrel protein, partial [Flavobacterium sp.]|nr:outer membrane beta-barrel protein [Flavobacterium sp.]